MTYFIRTLSVFSLIGTLAGCGSSDEKQLPIYGDWQVTYDDSTIYYNFSKSQLDIHIYSTDFECHTNSTLNFNNISDTSITTTDNHVTPYTIEGDILTIDEDETYTRSTPPEFISCADPESSGTLNITVEFENLPESFDITEEVTDEYTDSFDLWIEFDLSNDPEKTRTWSIFADYDFKGTQESHTISMNDLISSTYYYTGGDRDSFLVNAPYTINENAITFSFPRNSHKLLKEITSTSAIKVRASFNDKISDSQSDNYPNTAGYTDGIDLTNAFDAVGDVSGDYSSDTIVDIKSVTVGVSE